MANDQELIRNCQIMSCKHNNKGTCSLPPGQDCTEATVVKDNTKVKDRKKEKGKKWYELDK
jgi:hypothetical protein